MTTAFSTKYACRKCVGNIGEAVERVEKLCDDMETVSNVHISVTG